jgi:hypothetical protein
LGGGGGLGAVVPVIPKLLDFQAAFLAGNGIGRYDAVQLPDVTVKPTGVLAPVPELQAWSATRPTLLTCMRMLVSRRLTRRHLRSTASH